MLIFVLPIIKPNIYSDQRWAKLESETIWKRSAFFVNLLEPEWSWSLLSNFKIETKNDASVICELNVTTLVSQSLKRSESEY